MKENIENEIIYNYENVIIVKPNVNQIEEIIKDYKEYFENIANNVEVENLGIKKLAYEVRGFQEGKFVIFRYDTQKDKISDVERKFRIDENIIKFITVRNEPVFEEKMIKKQDNKRKQKPRNKDLR